MAYYDVGDPGAEETIVPTHHRGQSSAILLHRLHVLPSALEPLVGAINRGGRGGPGQQQDDRTLVNPPLP